MALVENAMDCLLWNANPQNANPQIATFETVPMFNKACKARVNLLKAVWHITKTKHWEMVG